MANLFESADELTACARRHESAPTLSDRMESPPPADEDYLPDDDEDDEAEKLPQRVLIHGRLFMRNGRTAVYTNIEDADDDRIFEYDPETGELRQWPDCD